MKCCHFFWLAVVITFLLVLRRSFEKRSNSVTCTYIMRYWFILKAPLQRGKMLWAQLMFCVIFDFSLLSLTARRIRTFEKRKAILSWLLNSVSEHSYRLEKCLFAIFSHDIKPYCLYKLFRFGMADSPTCAFCQTEVESGHRAFTLFPLSII